MTAPITMQFFAGTEAFDAARKLVAAAKEFGVARGMFNGVEMIADWTSTAEQVVAAWQHQIDRKAAAYRASPEGIAAAQKSERETRELQAKHDELVRVLPDLDWSKDVEVLKWLCALQESTDRIGVRVDREKIVAAFVERGFRPNVNTGPDYRPGDRDNEFRYLVGQALDGLTSGPAIHPILHKMAAEWTREFTGAST